AGHRLPECRRPRGAGPSQGDPGGVRAALGDRPPLPAQGRRRDQLRDHRAGALMAARVQDAVPQELEVHLVPMRRRHLRSVLRIEAQVYPRPWSLSLFMSELALRSSRAYYVARVGGAVVGYSGLMLTGEDAHVTTIAVDPAWHRHKIGTRLLLNLGREALRRQARHLTLEVRVGNEPAQAMYRQFGFRPAGIRKNYY